MKFVVAFYRIDRAFGGPEEGSWFYDTGALERLYRVYPHEAAARHAANRANRLLARIQQHRLPVSSVAYDQSRFQALAFERVPPEHYPQTLPTYS